MTPDHKRRSVLKMVVALSLPPIATLARAEQSRATQVLRRPIHSSGEQLPMIGLGTYQSFAVGSSQRDRDPLREVLRELVRLGGSVIDSSPMYGSSEGVVGDLSDELKLRPQLFMATKVWTSGKNQGIDQMNESFREMRVRVMDLMQVHNLVDWRTHANTLEDWKERGKIRYTGVTHYHSGAYANLESIMKLRRFDFAQFNYSIVEREAEQRLLPAALDNGTAVIINRPFAAGGLFRRVRGEALPPWAAEFDCTSWAQFFLKYIVSHPAVTCAIPATSKPKHLIDNMAAGYGRLPDEATRKRMRMVIDSL
ncbi:MAG: aldo/keto reductase [Betaproteobacteria bacterium]|nr:MAG: aldo/keto reductase [Betaproteobacteria bacterium]